MPNIPWQAALAQVTARTHHRRFLVLCADVHPHHDAWRAAMVALAGALRPPRPFDPATIKALRAQLKARIDQGGSAPRLRSVDLDVGAALKELGDLPPGEPRRGPCSGC